jgi:uncharacterized protein (UPF0333 family)
MDSLITNGSESMPSHSKRGQISLEFLFIFGILTILLLYSVRNTTFSEGSSSVENLKIQVALEEKGLADAVSNTISQVYAQGPGSKATNYIRLVYLKNPGYLEKAWDVKDPKIFITYGQLPGGPSGNGTYITIINGTGTTRVTLNGGDKNAFWSRSLYQNDLTGNFTAWHNSNATLNITGTPIRYPGLVIDPGTLPSSLRIVVEWNPDNEESWYFNQTAGEIRINIRPGG